MSIISQRQVRELIREGEKDFYEANFDPDGEDFSFNPGSFHHQCGHICRTCGGCERNCEVGGEIDYIDPEYDLLENWDEVDDSGWVEVGQDEGGMEQVEWLPDRVARRVKI